MSKIPIIMATDNNFVFQTGLAISSLLKNKKSNTVYQIYILSDGKLSSEGKKLINEICHKCGSDSAEYLDVPAEMFQQFEGEGHISVATYYRFVIADLLNDKEKCIFVDADTLILGDLTEAYSIDLKNNYLAAVLDCGIQYNWDNYREYFKEKEIPGEKEYFNAGFLVMNLAQMRLDNLKEKLIAEARNTYKLMDQDVLNICCRGKVIYLPLKYNFFAAYYQNGNFLKGTRYSEEEIMEAEENPIIIHYASAFKPWVNVAYDKEGLWWKEAELHKEYKQYDELKMRAFSEPKRLSWKNIIERCQEKENVIVFGYSNIGKSVVDMLHINGIQHVSAICDNDREKCGECYGNIPVKGIEEALEQVNNYQIVITSQNYSKEMKAQLLSLGIDSEDISVYVKKNFPYYYKLDRRYFREEIEEIFLKKYGQLEPYKLEVQTLVDSVNEDRLIFKQLLNRWRL